MKYRFLCYQKAKILIRQTAAKKGGCKQIKNLFAYSLCCFAINFGHKKAVVTVMYVTAVLKFDIILSFLILYLPAGIPLQKLKLFFFIHINKFE